VKHGYSKQKKRKKKEKIIMKTNNFFPDEINSQNVTSTTNTTWHCDITEYRLKDGSKVYIYLAVDPKTNTIVAWKDSGKTLNTKQIIKALEEAIEQRIPADQKQPTIIHTDRGGQFTSQEYYNFFIKHKGRVRGSHAAAGFHGNQVIERFNRTFKEHRVGGTNGLTLEQQLNIMEPKGLDRSRMIESHITDLNNTQNSKTKGRTASEQDRAIRLLNEYNPSPQFIGFSKHMGEDARTKCIESIDKTKELFLKEMHIQLQEGSDTTKELVLTQEQIAMLRVIHHQAELLYKQSERQYESLKEGQGELKEGQGELKEGQAEIISYVKPKEKQEHETLPLRDAVTKAILDKFLSIAGDTRKKANARTKTQIQTIYTILYYTGMRINEARHLNFEDIRTAIQNKEIKVILHKTKTAHKYHLTDEAVRALEALQPGLKILEAQKYKYIFAKKTIIAEQKFIKMVNKELKIACEHYGIEQNIKSHSFRIGRITSLLKRTDIQKVALIIGHADIKNTLQYQRTFLDKNEIVAILKMAEQKEE
jgi:integrase